jgi:hypothetical protein
MAAAPVPIVSDVHLPLGVHVLPSIVYDAGMATAVLAHAVN